MVYSASDQNTALKIQFQSTIRKKIQLMKMFEKVGKNIFFENNKTQTITKKFKVNKKCIFATK